MTLELEAQSAERVRVMLSATESDRLVGFIQSGCALAAQDGIPQSGELIAASVREALMVLSKAAGSNEKHRWRDLTEALQSSLARLDQDEPNSIKLDEVVAASRRLVEFKETDVGQNLRGLREYLQVLHGDAPYGASGTYLLQEFKELLDSANRGLHGVIPHSDATGLLSQLIEFVNRLFKPFEESIRELTLVVRDEPASDENVRRVLGGTFSVVRHTAVISSIDRADWIIALADAGQLDPEPNRPWAAASAIARVGGDAPEECVHALEIIWNRIGREGDGFRVVTAAMACGAPGRHFAVEILRESTGALWWAHAAMQVVGDVESTDLAVGELLRIASEFSVGDRTQMYLDPLMHAFVDGVDVGNAQSRLDLALYGAAKFARSEDFEALHLASDAMLTAPGIGSRRWSISRFVCEVVVRVIDRVSVLGGDPLESVAYERVPLPLQTRLIVYAASKSRGEFRSGRVREAVRTSVLVRDPSTDDVALWDRLRSTHDSWVEDLHPALGEAIGAWPFADDQSEISHEAARAYRWLGVLPGAVANPWGFFTDSVACQFDVPRRFELKPTSTRLRAEWGNEACDALLEEVGLSRARVPTELHTALSVIRDRTSLMGSDFKLDLSQRLSEDARRRPELYGQDLASVAQAAGSDLVTTGIIDGLTAQCESDPLLADAAFSALLETVDREVEGRHSDASMADVERRRILVVLARHVSIDTCGSQEIWAHLSCEVDCPVGDSLPAGVDSSMTEALASAPARALDVAHVLDWRWKVATGRPLRRFTSLLDSALAVPANRTVVAIAIAGKFAYLQRRHRTWFDRNWEAVAAGGLDGDGGNFNPIVIDAALRTNAVPKAVLVKAIDTVRALREEGSQPALDHTLVAMLLGYKGYAPNRVVQELRRAGQLKLATDFLASAVGEAPPGKVVRNFLAYWKAVNGLQKGIEVDVSGLLLLSDASWLEDAQVAALAIASLTRSHVRPSSLDTLTDRLVLQVRSANGLKLAILIVTNVVEPWDREYVCTKIRDWLTKTDPLAKSRDAQHLSGLLTERGF